MLWGAIRECPLSIRRQTMGLPSPVLGMDIASDGTIYLVGNDAASTPGHNIGVVRRGIPDGNGSHVWETVFVTEPYPRSGTAFDHNYERHCLESR